MTKETTTKNQITEGVIWRQLLIFFFPIVIGTLFQQLYNTVDAIIVGRFVGKQALASVGGSAAVLSNLVIGFFTGLSAGATVIISQHYGAKNKRNLRESLHTAYAFSIIASLILAVLGWILTPWLLTAIKTPADVLTDSILYLRIYFLGMISVLIFNMGSGIMRAIGDSKRPLYYLIICCLLNIVLDVVMVLIFRLGIAGVAVATVISQSVSAVLVTRALMTSYDTLKLSLTAIRISPSMLRSELRIGFPSGLESSMYGITNIIIQAAVNEFGTDTAAAWAAYGKLDAIFRTELRGKTVRPCVQKRPCLSGHVVWHLRQSVDFLSDILPSSVPYLYNRFNCCKDRRLYAALHYAQLHCFRDHRDTFGGAARNRRCTDSHSDYTGGSMLCAPSMDSAGCPTMAPAVVCNGQLSYVLDGYGYTAYALLFI